MIYEEIKRKTYQWQFWEDGKSDECTKHYLTQMQPAINWRCWQARKNSRMRMKVQGRLIQACFIEIHQDFTKKSDTLLTDLVYLWYLQNFIRIYLLILEISMKNLNCHEITKSHQTTV